MNNNSLSAYFDENNQKKFNSHRARIIRELFSRPNQHSYMLSDRLLVSNEGIKKRLTELLQDGIIEVSSIEEFYGNKVSCYKITNEQKELHKKQNLRQWLKEKYPNILFEFESLIEHKL